MFGKHKKGEIPAQSISEQTNAAENRDDFLSAWSFAAESFQMPENNTESDNQNAERGGYIFCRKCYEVCRSTELKCPSCGCAKAKKQQ